MIWFPAPNLHECWLLVGILWGNFLFILVPLWNKSRCVHAQSLQSCLTLCNPVDCSSPGSSVHGDSPGKNTGVGCHAILQGIFPTQRSDPDLLWLLNRRQSLLSLDFCWATGKPKRRYLKASNYLWWVSHCLPWRVRSDYICWNFPPLRVLGTHKDLPFNLTVLSPSLIYLARINRWIQGNSDSCSSLCSNIFSLFLPQRGNSGFL